MKILTIIALAVMVFTANAGAASPEKTKTKAVGSKKIAVAAKKVPEPAAPSRTVGKTEWPLNIPPADAKTYLETEKPVLLDVRTPEEYAAGHLANSILIDYRAADFKDNLNKLDKTVKYLIYCRSGHRSGLALQIMKELGFADYHDIAGGINAWTAAGLPVVQ